MLKIWSRVSNGTPLQYSCLESPMDGGAWKAAVHGVATTERLHFHFSLSCIGEGNGNLLQYSCLENPRDGSLWGRTESDMTEPLHFHSSLLCIGEGNGKPLPCSCLENPRDDGPGGLPSMESHRVWHNWSDLAVAAAEIIIHVDWNGGWHCTGDPDQDYSHGKEIQKSKMAFWGGLTNSCEKKRSKKPRRKGKI